MSHYLTKEEQSAKEQEVLIAQNDPCHLLSVVFHKDNEGWYANIPTHTRSENAMVAGADIAIGRMAHGDNTVEIRFRTLESTTLGKPICKMNRILHDRFGGTYLVHGLTAIPFPAWLCCVTHDITGEHPKHIFIHDIKHYSK